MLVDPYDVKDICDGLTMALDDEPLRERLSAAGRARAMAFSWERSVRAIHDAYLDVLGLPAPARTVSETLH